MKEYYKDNSAKVYYNQETDALFLEYLGKVLNDDHFIQINTAVRKGTAGERIQQILAEIKPEAAYFTEYDGRRGAILIVDVAEPSRIPSLAEPAYSVK